MELNLSPDISPALQAVKARLGIVGNAPALLQALQRAVTVAPIDLSVLITGESGTGKEHFPQLIHQGSPRKHARYIAVNCGAIPEGTIDSELFGHEKGAFTGAVATRKGYFEEADGGTVFLDEVAELPLTTQARLLRVLESGEFMKVGSSVVQRTNTRIVAATNVDLRQAIARGRFREDLYYRLSTVTIQLPPLRERGRDVLLLARKFAADFAERYLTREITLDASARDALLHYRWPGNVRQLKNVIDQVALFEAGEAVTADTLRSYLPGLGQTYALEPCAPGAGADSAGSASASGGSGGGGSDTRYERERDMLLSLIFSLRRQVDELRAIVEERPAAAPAPAESAPAGAAPHDPARLLPPRPQTPPQGATIEATERELIRASLERNNGRRKATARELDISERTLYRKIKEYGLDDV